MARAHTRLGSRFPLLGLALLGLVLLGLGIWGFGGDEDAVRNRPQDEPTAGTEVAEAPHLQGSPTGVAATKEASPDSEPARRPAPADSERSTCRLRIRVETEAGDPVPGARVLVRRHDDMVLLEEAQTGHEGTAIVSGLPPARSRRDGSGRVRVAVRDARWVAVQAGDYKPSYLLRENETVEIVVMVRDARSIQGTVRDPTGRVEGATVIAVQDPRWGSARGGLRGVALRAATRSHAATAVTDAQGRFELTGLRPDKPHMLVAFSPLHAPAISRLVKPDPADAYDVLVELERGTGTTIRVLDSRGDPVAYATGQIMASYKGARAKWFRAPNPIVIGKAVDIRLAWRADADGTVHIDPLPKDGSFFYRVDAAGFRSLPTSDKVPPVFPRNEAELEVRLEEGAILEGVMVDANGAPRAGVDVWVLDGFSESSSSGSRSSSWVAQQTVTDTAGRFALGGLAPHTRVELHFGFADRPRESRALAGRDYRVVRSAIYATPGNSDLRLRVTSDGRIERVKR